MELEHEQPPINQPSISFGKSRWEERREEEKAAKRRAVEMAAEGVAAFAPSRQTVGDFVGLCLLIDFPDERETISRQEVDNFCNQRGYVGFGNNGSVYDYFFDISGGKLRYTNLVTPYYTARHPKSYYTDPSLSWQTHGPVRAQELIREALDYFMAQGFDGFDNLTVDEQQNVYAVNTFYAGSRTNQWSEGLWPHQSSLSTAYSFGNGTQARDYQITDIGSELSLGTFCHENGHMLCDFPDLYAYYDLAGNRIKKSGIGAFCLMCGGGNANPKNPTHVNPYLKLKAGWLGSLRTLNWELQQLANAGNPQAELPLMAEAGKNQFFLFNKGELGATEYFLIENRNQVARDADLPGSGLAIWHIDELGDNTGRFGTGTNIECALVQADGRFELENTNSQGDTTDLFASGVKDHFGGANDPSARWWDGAIAGLQIKSISAPGATMRFTAVATGDPEIARLTVATDGGVNLRRGPALDYPILLPGNQTNNKSFDYRISSLVTDKNGLTWAEVKIDPPVDWANRGWLCVKQGVNYYTTPHLDAPTVLPPAFLLPPTLRTTVTVIVSDGVRVRSGPGLDFAVLIPAYRTRNKTFLCRTQSGIADQNGYSWMEVNLLQPVKGYSKGWLAVAKGDEMYVQFGQL